MTPETDEWRVVLTLCHRLLGWIGLFDPPLLALAALVCAGGTYTVFTCLGRAWVAPGRLRWLWLCAVCVSFGADIWATQYIAMLSYLPLLPYSYDVGTTLYAIAIAILGSVIPFTVVIFKPSSRFSVSLAGICLGATIGFTHFTSIIAMNASRCTEDRAFCVAALAFGAIMSGIAIAAAKARGRRYRLILATGCLMLGIFGLYFIGMAGFSLGVPLLQADQLALLDHTLLAAFVNTESTALAVASVSGVVSIAAFCAAMADRRIGALQAHEATKLRYQMRHDETTGLANRLLLRECLKEAIDLTATGNFAILIVDLDRFKPVNDLYGRATGDHLLRLAAARLQERINAADIVARIGGDKFVILYHAPYQPDAFPSAAIGLAEQLVHSLEAPFIFDGKTIAISASIGVALHQPDIIDAEMLLQDGEIALGHARAAGGGQPCLFETAMRLQQEMRRRLEQDFRQAIVDLEFTLHYQPLFESDDLTLSGFEALVRWEHPERGMISPAKFIPFAEKSGLIIPLGLWVLETACRQAASWPDHLRISINISPVQLCTRDLVGDIVAALQQSGLAPHRLELEVTEGALIQNPEQARTILSRLKAMGVQISIDDFGTGYSSLSYLRHFPFDRIKIDRSFIENLETEPDALLIVRAIINLGHSLRVGVLAEGIETPGQLRVLRQQNCDQLQGYLLGRPVPVHDAIALVQTHLPPAGRAFLRQDAPVQAMT